MSTILAHLAGRWSDAPPREAGVYFARTTNERASPQVRCWDPCAWTQGAAREGDVRTSWEFFYLEGDVLGRPSRADDPLTIARAKADGWRPSNGARARG